MKILAEPRLHEPVAVVGFGGWANAGEVSTGTLAYLERALEAAPLAHLEPGFYYDYAGHRPTARIQHGRIKSLNLPRNRFSFSPSEAGPATILFSGEEPHLGWELFAQEMIDLLLRFGARLLITVGGTYDERLHTSPPQVTVVGEDEALLDRLVAAGAGLGQYSGPISIHSVLLQACRRRGLAAVSLWGHAPVYVQTGNFSLIERVLDLIARVGGPCPDLSSLATARREMEAEIEGLIKRSPKLAGYVQKLQGQQAKEGGRTEPLPPRGAGKIIPLIRIKPEEDPSA